MDRKAYSVLTQRLQKKGKRETRAAASWEGEGLAAKVKIGGLAAQKGIRSKKKSCGKKKPFSKEKKRGIESRQKGHESGSRWGQKVGIFAVKKSAHRGVCLFGGSGARIKKKKGGGCRRWSRERV